MILTKASFSYNLNALFCFKTTEKLSKRALRPSKDMVKNSRFLGRFNKSTSQKCNIKLSQKCLSARP